MLRSSTLFDRKEVVKFLGFRFLFPVLIIVGVVDLCNFLIVLIIDVVNI